MTLFYNFNFLSRSHGLRGNESFGVLRCRSSCFSRATWKQIHYFNKIILLIIIFCFLTACEQTPLETNRVSVEQQGIEAAEKPYFSPAFEFPLKLAWLNVSRPLTLADLKGRVIVFDFWTYGCVNCLHANAILKEIKQKYADQLLIISIHTPKFENEKNLQTLNKNVQRFEMTHPVVNDVDRLLAKKYKVQAWPTFVVLNQNTEIVGKTVGENRLWLVDKAIKKLLADDSQQKIMPKLPLQLEKTKSADQMLFAPSKIDINAQYVAISDNLHHRILIADHQGNIKAIYGDKKKGFKDGNKTQVRFSFPQGLVLVDNGLYIADSGNHRIRFIDFKSQLTSTVAGGAKDKVTLLYPFDAPLQATKTALSSPWDLVYDKTKQQLFIAMAGVHQIWQYQIKTSKISILAGTGKEGIKNDRFEEASFSQPQGLSLFQNKLMVADAESSAIRQLDLKTQTVETLNGTGLFDFGDQDDDFKHAKLQHPNAIQALNQSQFLISDSYNHKIKQLDLNTKKITTLIGNGRVGRKLQPLNQAILNEPSDIAVYEDLILIVDSNNDRILRYDLKQQQLFPFLFKKSF